MRKLVRWHISCNQKSWYSRKDKQPGRNCCHSFGLYQYRECTWNDQAGKEGKAGLLETQNLETVVIKTIIVECLTDLAIKVKKKKSNLSSPSRDIPPILVARRDCSRWMYSMKSRTDHIILYILFHSWHWHSRLMENNRNNG